MDAVRADRIGDIVPEIGVLGLAELDLFALGRVDGGEKVTASMWAGL